jgi:hypothetical protein
MLEDRAFKAAMRTDLARRVAELTRTEAQTFPRFSALEWTLAWAACVGLPLVLWRAFA